MTTFPSIKIDANSQYTKSGRNKRNEFGDNYSQTSPDGLNPFDEIWDLSFTARNKTDVSTIASFLDAGPINGASFSWQAPTDASAKNWQMKHPASYKISDGENNTQTIKFTIIRYFGNG